MSSKATEPTTTMLIRFSINSFLIALFLSRFHILANNQFQFIFGSCGNFFSISKDGMGQGRPAFATASGRHLGNGLAHNFAGILRILRQHGDNLIDSYRIVMRMPAIIVGHHGHSDVADFGFASQLCLLQIGHADHVHAHGCGTHWTRLWWKTVDLPCRGKCRHACR